MDLNYIEGAIVIIVRSNVAGVVQIGASIADLILFGVKQLGLEAVSEITY